MLFDPRPKERIEDFFDMEDELERLVRELADSSTRMVIILGPRRTGKTSLLKVALNSLSSPSLLLDARETLGSEDYLNSVLAKALEEVLRGGRFMGLLRSVLRRVRGVSVYGVEVRLGEEPRRVMLDLLEEANSAVEGSLIFAVDEAQELAGVRWFPSALAYIYDNLDRVKLVLTGSEVRLLDTLIRVDDPESPLYGRPFVEIHTRRLSPDEAIEFLRRGFEEVGVSVGEGVLLRAVEVLDGVIGWLTYFGWYCWKLSDAERALERTLKTAKGLVAAEVERFLAGRTAARARYLTIMRALSTGELTWSEVRRYLEVRLGRRIPPNQLSKYLRNLIRYGFLEKREGRYRLADPLIGYAVRDML